MEPIPQPPAADPRPFAARLEDALPALRAYVARLAKGHERDELVQDVAARALRSADRHDPRRPLGPWLRRTALRAWIDAQAGRGRRPHAVSSPDVPVDSQELRAVDAGEEVDYWLARLGAVERDVLDRFHRQGQSLREIAAALAMPEGTIKSHLHRARRKLAELRGDEDSR